MDGAATPPHPLLPLALRLGAIAGIATMAMFVKLSAEAGIHLAARERRQAAYKGPEG